MQTTLHFEESASERYRLEHSRGYGVEGGRGRLGVVEEADPSIEVLEVQLARDGRRIVLVPYDAAALIDPHKHRLLLKTSPRLPGPLRKRSR